MEFDRPGDCSPELRSDVDSDNLCASRRQSKASCISSVDGNNIMMNRLEIMQSLFKKKKKSVLTVVQ